MIDLAISGRLHQLNFCVWLEMVVLQLEQVHEFEKLVYREMAGDVRFFFLLELGQVGQFPFCDVILKLAWEEVEVKVSDYERDLGRLLPVMELIYRHVDAYFASHHMLEVQTSH